MESIFAALNSAISSTQQTVELNGRELFTRRAIVTNNNDPEGQRRIKVALASKGGQLESNWIQRVQFSPSFDDPLPKRGQTVLVMAVDGNPHDMAYLGVITNDPNPSLDKSNAVDDQSQEIEGESKVTIGSDYTVNCGKSIRLQNTAGAYLELNESGFVILGDAFGHVWTLGGGAGGSGWNWDANGASINIENATDFQVNGKSITTIGAFDSRGDNLVNRGW
jgi:hypothetical protein